MSVTCFQRDPRAYDRWVHYVHDSRRGEDIGSIAHADGDDLVSFHVTDGPQRLIRFLRRRGDVRAAFGPRGRSAELGPGLYVGNPRFWTGRSTDKWAFLTRITSAERERLIRALQARVDAERTRGYITENEHERAVRTLDRAARGLIDFGGVVGLLANQPYNVAFWRPEFLQTLGIAAGGKPGVVEVRFRGRFAELAGSHPPATVLRLLRRAGLQGAFTRAGMTTNPELVIWDPRAVVGASIVEGET